ncbi:hypothetical protein KAR91_37830 [Candidatus Pacearchaeota archaeon]|nr:hypothetical protein [Candidatus Pacearchaeota archaeon]
MRPVEIDKFIERLECDVYPIAIAKYLLNKGRILSYFSKVAAGTVVIKGNRYLIDPTTCDICDSKKSHGYLCRQHTSIVRVLNADSVLYDLDTNTYIYKNEIFREIDGKLVIFYCPHPKLIAGKLSDSKVRKVNITTVEDPNFKGLPVFKNVCKFVSSELMNQYMKCWFNTEFSLITIPEDRSQCNWCLVPNY